jgi:hypothetical protein
VFGFFIITDVAAPEVKTTPCGTWPEKELPTWPEKESPSCDPPLLSPEIETSRGRSATWPRRDLTKVKVLHHLMIGKRTAHVAGKRMRHLVILLLCHRKWKWKQHRVELQHGHGAT